MKYREMTPEQKEARKAYLKQYHEEHQEEHHAYQKQYREEHREERKKYRAEHREKYRARMKKILAEDLNSNGITKNYIRARSNRLLSKSHTKLPGYQIHHCFGYEDPSKFIYIPKSLHLQIHQLLRDNKISADSDHWMAIRDLVNSCEEYVYIKG